MKNQKAEREKGGVDARKIRGKKNDPPAEPFFFFSLEGLSIS